MKDFFKRIKNPLLRLAFRLLESRLAKGIQNIVDAAVKSAAEKLLDLSSDYVSIFTDANEKNKEQVEEFLKKESAKHVDVGKSLLLAATAQIKDVKTRADVEIALDFLAAQIAQEIS